MSDSKEKEIEISNFKQNYQPGQEVTVIFQESQGFLALLFGYGLPFLLVFLTLVIAQNITGNEAVAGLLSLVVLVPYYTTLYFFRHVFKKVFRFEVEERG